jgi:hypothetical protein
MTPAMTRLLEEMRKHPGAWFLTDGGRIRRPRRNAAAFEDRLCCPLSSINEASAGFYGDGARALDMTGRQVEAVVRAADNQTRGPIRRALLQAAGLKESAGGPYA